MKVIIGKKAILDAIENHSLVKAVISNKDKFFYNKVKNAIKDVIVNNDKSFYDKTTNYVNHQFAIGYVNHDNNFLSLTTFLSSIQDKKNALILLLDSIEDPQNFGAIIRTAEALGIDGIIYKKDGQCQITPAVIKVSAGAVNNVNLIRVTNLNDAIAQLKKDGFWIYASCIDKQAFKLHDSNFKGRVGIIVGNENKGISPLVIKNADFKIFIESYGKTQSLNVSAATAILLYTIKSSLDLESKK